MTSKSITAVRISGNRYDVFYSDDKAFDREVTWEYVVRMAKQHRYAHIDVKQHRYCPEGEPVERRVMTADA